METTKPLNLYEKLVAVRKSVEYLKKGSKGYQFNYVSSSQTIMSVRKEMDAQKLLLIPTIVGKKVTERHTQKGTVEYFVELDMKYTWVNAECITEQITCDWYGQGIDTGEKGVGKALTYAEKYFLLKFFNIATDNADPDMIANSQQALKARPAPMPMELIGLFNSKGVMKAKRDAMWLKALEQTNNDANEAVRILKEQLEGANATE